MAHGVRHSRQQCSINIQSVATNNSYNSTHTFEYRGLRFLNGTKGLLITLKNSMLAL